LPLSSELTDRASPQSAEFEHPYLETKPLIPPTKLRSLPNKGNDFHGVARCGEYYYATAGGIPDAGRAGTEERSPATRWITALGFVVRTLEAKRRLSLVLGPLSSGSFLAAILTLFSLASDWKHTA
jgi:hypothetical protein